MLFFSVRYDFLYFIYFHKLIKINIFFLYINNLKDLELGITFRIFTEIFALDYLLLYCKFNCDQNSKYEELLGIDHILRL